MPQPARSAHPSQAGSHLVLYDGVCGLCNRLLHFVLVRDGHAVFRFASLQSNIGRAMVKRFGGNPDDLTTLYVVADYQSATARAFTRSRGALFIARRLGWPWKLALAFRVLPTAVLDRLYGLVASSRYRIFGRYEQCPIPRPEHRTRFIDVSYGS
jgi:predicted DCC family thiol-disulfide oxidoreductase YuxK